MLELGLRFGRFRSWESREQRNRLLLRVRKDGGGLRFGELSGDCGAGRISEDSVTRYLGAVGGQTSFFTVLIKHQLINYCKPN